MENIVVIQFGSGGEIGNKGRNQDGNSVASKYKDWRMRESVLPSGKEFVQMWSIFRISVSSEDIDGTSSVSDRYYYCYSFLLLLFEK